MLTTDEVALIRRTVEDLIATEIAYSWEGVGWPEDKPLLEEDLAKARATFETTLTAMNSDWTPTSENINALPEPVRRYVMELETLCDPAGLVRENAQLKDVNRGLQEMYQRVAEELRVSKLPNIVIF